MTRTISTAGPVDAAGARADATARWVLCLTAAASMVVSLDAFVVTTALPTIRVDLHSSAATLEWTVTAYTLSFAVLLMTGSALGDRCGRRRMFLAGLMMFAAASIGCALSPGVEWLIAARAVQGAAAALVMPLALALLGSAFGPAQRPRALSAFAGIIAISVAFGPLVGGAVVEGVSWPWIFWVNVPAVAVLAWLARRHIPESAGTGERFDVIGVLLATTASLGIVWALVRGNTVDWASGETVGALVAGAAAGLAFWAWERRTDQPMLPLRLFRSRRFALGNVGVFLLWASTFGVIYFLAQYLQLGLGYSPLVTGVRMLPWGIPPILVSRVVGGLILRWGERPFVVAGTGLAAAGAAALGALASPHLAYWTIAVLLAVHGTGVAIAMVGIQTAAMTPVDGADLAKASGTFNTLRQLGGSFGVAAGVAAFTSAGGYSSAGAFVDGFVAAMIVLAGVAALGLLLATLLPRRCHEPSRTHTR